jgi:hypothetical protein
MSLLAAILLAIPRGDPYLPDIVLAVINARYSKGMDQRYATSKTRLLHKFNYHPIDLQIGY